MRWASAIASPIGPTSSPAASSNVLRRAGLGLAADMVFADEPTGNLDSRSSVEVLGLLRRAVDDFGQTVVMVTHDPTAAAHSDTVVFLADGKVVDRLDAPTADSVLARMRGFESTGS